MAQEIVKAGLSVYANLSGATGSTLTAIGYAQSYTLNLDVATEEIADLADAFADWSKPEPQKKTWTIDVDSFVVRDIAGTKLSSAQILSKIKNDVKCVIAIKKSADTTGYEYGYAYLTNFSQSGNVGAYHTWNCTFSGWGQLLTK